MDTHIHVPEYRMAEFVPDDEVELDLRKVVDRAAAERNEGMHVALRYECVDARILEDVDLHVAFEIRYLFQAAACGGDRGHQAGIHPHCIREQVRAHRRLIFDRRVLVQSLRDHLISTELFQQLDVTRKTAGDQYFGGQTQ